MKKLILVLATLLLLAPPAEAKFSLGKCVKKAVALPFCAVAIAAIFAGSALDSTVHLITD